MRLKHLNTTGCLSFFYNIVVQLGLINVLLATTWLLLSQVNFFYPRLHTLINIDTHIQIYGPQNRYKPNFEQTDPAQHHRLFADILAAVNGLALGQSNAPDLKAIHYEDRYGATHTLLRDEEVGHLEDVSKLLRLLLLTGLVSSMVVTVIIVGFKSRFKLYHLKATLVLWSTLSTLISLGILLAGPKRVFYTLHTWVFPPDHPWFFYYQDSLMTTLMKAPYLFAPMSLLWAGTSLFGFVLVYAGLLGLTQTHLRARPKTN